MKISVHKGLNYDFVHLALEDDGKVMRFYMPATRFSEFALFVSEVHDQLEVFNTVEEAFEWTNK